MQVMMIGTDLMGKGGISTVVRGYFDAGLMDRLCIDYYPTHCEGSKGRKIAFYFKALLRITKRMQRYKIIHVHMASKWSFRRLSLPLILAKLLQKKRVIHLHGGMFDVYYYKSISLEKALIRYIFSIADKVVVLSSGWQRKISSFADINEIIVIPNAVRLKSLKNSVFSTKSEYPYRILFLGEICQRKGVYDLLEAIKTAKIDYSKIKVDLGGNGEIENVRNYVSEFGLEKIVEIHGWVSGEKKQKLLEEAYLFVLPSYYEGLPMSILEALATGTPVVSTPVGGIPYVIRDGYNGFLIETNSPQKIVDRIEKVFYDKKLWAKLSRNALQTIKGNFTIERTEAKIYALYNSLTSVS